MMNLLKSSRFQGLLLIGVLQALVLFHVITGEQSQGLIQIIQAIVAGAVVVRTVDRSADVKADAVVEAARVQ